ncbi:MAG TPA: hypothetical protein VFL17_17645, partial [Anaerolineae bacterium]|nr:hypothetical protein [Anaerolineae bacterium]
DWLIPMSESHLRSILRAWTGHYKRGRPHMALGPGGERLGVCARSVLGGLHHEYLAAPALA